MRKHFWKLTMALLLLMALSLPALAQEKIEEKAAVKPASRGKGRTQTVLQRCRGRIEPVHLSRL